MQQVQAAPAAAAAAPAAAAPSEPVDIGPPGEYDFILPSTIGLYGGGRHVVLSVWSRYRRNSAGDTVLAATA
jgi:hypothetical protein